jgi:hypothetical protein
LKIELFGVREAAEFFGLTKQALFQRRKDPLFPKPEAQLHCGPVWTREQLESYQSEKIGDVGRLNIPDARRALELARDTFKFYAQQHRAKTQRPNLSPGKLEDTIRKAVVNEELVTVLDAVLKGEQPEWPETSRED